MPLSASVAVIVAPATTAPCGSVILPLISAVAPPAWANANDGSAAHISAKKKTRARMYLICPPKMYRRLSNLRMTHLRNRSIATTRFVYEASAGKTRLRYIARRIFILSGHHRDDVKDPFQSM